MAGKLESGLGFYKNCRVLITGHTGFKGSWLSIVLDELGAEVFGYSLPPAQNNSFYTEISGFPEDKSCYADIRDSRKLEEWIARTGVDIIFHLAAQPIVRRSYADPIDTYETNVLGTLYLLEAARKSKSVKAVIVVTSDKCYENLGKIKNYRETDKLGGRDPYSSSKACSEILAASYRRSFFREMQIGLATARAGNVIGGGDWSEDRLIPDCFKKFFRNQPAELRSPDAVRPWQHVLDVLAGYLRLGHRLYEDSENFSESWNFGPTARGYMSAGQLISDLVYLASKKYGVVWTWESIPVDSQVHEEMFLGLDSSKAIERLDWGPTLDQEASLESTLNWYWAWKERVDMDAFSRKQVSQFLEVCGL